jgi:N-methylhydantoinase A/oxoprolinase/acetone carboxylase beta subunit
MKHSDPARPLFLGIDTGGTYTDAVLWSETAGIVAKAKALTTRHDLAVGNRRRRRRGAPLGAGQA